MVKPGMYGWKQKEDLESEIVRPDTSERGLFF